MAVQLRLVTQGEASAAVCDCLAAGLPTVATDLGWVTELPDDVVERVAPDVTPVSLGATLSRLLGVPSELDALAAAGRAYAAENDFAAVARRYLEVLGLPARD